ncbi:MAG TPA: hypothetical protein VNE00_23450 [Paraburkholderia sp.]|jgi:hypothetical protein|nr:hypothetical protein [Paraburkholderia sp.]
MNHGKLTAVAIALAAAAATSALTRTALASGYGPAPFYQPADGAPASQRGMSAQALAADDARVHRMNETDTTKQKRDYAETLQSTDDKR